VDAPGVVIPLTRRREQIPGRAPRRPGRVRLTRRGRVVVLVFFLLLAGLGVAIAAPASRAADPAGDPPTAVVLPGDTLWSVAERYAPGDDPFGTIEEIRRLNGLRDNTVYTGQHLTLPNGG
jgi:LysM repeat protein